MERRCREIDAMESSTRASEAELAFDNPYLDNPAWNREMLGYFAKLKENYRRATEHPRDPPSPDPPVP
jgi:hypothetical protein